METSDGEDDDRSTIYSYDGADHVILMQANLPGTGAFQKTEYIYDATTGAGHDLNSRDILTEIRYPNLSSGEPSTTLKEVFKYNRLGERKTFADRNGTTHTYTYDVVGRLTDDSVIGNLGSGVDTTVQKLSFSYDSAARAEKFTSKNSSGTVKNEVQREYNGLGQLTKEYQEHGGAVNTSTSLKVQYAFSEMSGSANHSRPISMTYPNNRVLHYRYRNDTVSGDTMDNDISRVSELASASTGGTVFEGYSYLGLDTIVKRAHPQPGVDLTYDSGNDTITGTAGDRYVGLDRFGRVIDQRWKGASSDTDRFKYGYDRNGNRRWRDNVLTDSLSGASDLDELYHEDDADPTVAADSLDRLIDFQRGELSDGDSDGNYSVSSAARTLEWSLDALGNWKSITTDGDSTETRTHNKQNQITSGGLTYDNNGNLTSGGNSYDAWNRLAKHTVGDDTTPYAYDALGRRISIGPTTHSQSGPEQDAVNLYYSDRWQVIHERTEVEGGGGSSGTIGGNEESLGPEGGGLPFIQQTDYVWSEAYVDALVLRDRDVDLDGSLEERLYVQHDANFNVTALINTSGVVVERFYYDPYGSPTFLNPDWTVDTGGSDYGWIYLHQGLRREVKSDTYDNRERPYDADLGRFWSQDPIGYVDGMNLYQYLGSSPTSRRDPSGLVWLGEQEWNERKIQALITGRPILNRAPTATVPRPSPYDIAPTFPWPILFDPYDPYAPEPPRGRFPPRPFPPNTFGKEPIGRFSRFWQELRVWFPAPKWIDLGPIAIPKFMLPPDPCEDRIVA